MKRAHTETLDAILDVLVMEEQAICKRMAEDDERIRLRLLPRLVTVSIAITSAKLDRSELIRRTFYR